jgi:hypothetical protein
LIDRHKHLLSKRTGKENGPNRGVLTRPRGVTGNYAGAYTPRPGSVNMHENGANYHQAKVKVHKPPQPFFFALFLAIIILQGVKASEHYRRWHI